MTEMASSHGFSRRSFIKGAAVLGAAGALVGCTPKEDDKDQVDPAGVAAAEEQIFSGACSGNCAGGCFMNVHVRDGQVVRTTARELPDPEYTRICCKGVTHVGRMYGPNRLLYPMRRIEGTERGTNEFERISWDEAIDEIVTKWKQYTDEFGPEAMAFMSGSGNYHACSGTGLNGGMNRFKNIVGASTLGFNVDAAAYIGWMRAGGATIQPNEAKDILNAKTVICWGCNPSVSSLHVMHFILEAKEAGAKYIVIDPVFNANTSKADWFVPVKAATDGALAMGILNVLFNENKLDENLLKNKTNCPFLIKEDGMFLHLSEVTGEAPAEGAIDPYVVWDLDTNAAVAYTESTNPALTGVAPINGINVHTAMDNALEQIAQYTPAKAAEICGLAEEDIRELARVYVEDGPVYTLTMMGTDHYSNGQYNTWAQYLVAILTGNTGKPGASVGFPQFTSGHLLSASVVSPVDANGNPCQGAGRTILDNKLLETFETGKYVGEDITIKGAYIACINPMCTLVDRNAVVKVFNMLDFIVVCDVCMTETARYADIVLPAAYWYEQTDLFNAFGTHPFLLWTDKAVDPIGEAKTDYEIYGLILEGLGYGDMWQMTSDEYIQALLDTDAARAAGCSYEEIKEKKACRMFPDPYITNEGGWLTDTGRASVYYDYPFLKAYEQGQEFDPMKEQQLYWEEARWIGDHSEYRARHPFHLFSDHMRTRTHSQWWDCDYVKEYEPEPVVRMNSADAAELGVGEGDSVRLYNDLGEVVMKVNIHEGLPRKMVSSPRAFQAEEFISGHYASLGSLEFNQNAANIAFNDVAVSIEKA